MKLFNLPNLFKNYTNFLSFLSLFFFLTNVVYANENIIISNNNYISSNTIKSYIPKNFNILKNSEVNNYQKKLFETGFFEDIKVSVKNNKLYVKVFERPLVNFFYIEGIKNQTILDNIYKIVKIKENTLFTPYLLNNDSKEIIKYLNSLGYLNSQFNYKLIKIKDNKVNLFYNINLNNKYKINRIYFIGNKFFKSSTLLGQLFSTEHGWWKFMANNTTPSESLISIDISRLKNFYLNEGFYDAQVISSSVKILNNSKVNLTYSINAGNRHYIKNIELIDNSKTLKKEDFIFLNSKYKKNINKIFDKSKINNFFNYTNDYFLKSNYNLDLKYRIEKTGNNILNVKFVAEDKIKKQTINKIIISGNSITDDKVIRNNLKFYEGDVLNSLKITESVDILKGKGIFKNVSWKIENNDNNQDNPNISINVEEQPTGEIAAGAGGGTNGLAISGTLKEKNFNGKGILLNSSLSIGTQRILGNISYSNPDFDDTGNKFDGAFFINENYFENASFENKQIGSSIGITYEVFEKLFFNPGLSIDFDSVTANNDASALVKRSEGDFFTSKIYYNAFKNTKNKDFQATSGYTVGFGQGFSFLSDIPYVNNKFFGSYYDEFANDFIGSIRYKIESITSFDKDIKYSDRLFVNSNNIRGFSDRGIGPKIDNDFIGGNYSYYTTLSSTFPNGLPEKWNALTNVFFDMANVWGTDDKSIDDSNKLRSSAGIGLSWLSPLGPLSFTYAIPITKMSSDDVENFNFTIGSAF